VRFGPDPIDSPYLIQSASFIGCHQFNFIEKVDVLESARPGATFLLNSPFGPTKSGISCHGVCKKPSLTNGFPVM